MKDSWVRASVGLMAAAIGTPVTAQEALAPERQAALDQMVDLMNTPVTVASRKALPRRDSPGIITVLTREDILESGARSLLELLQGVPGFQATYTGQNTTSVTVRGLLALDGKCLVLVDGVEMNERRYGTITLDNRFHLDQVQRIEIIRGPGSALYGGFAEYAVVNIVTRSGRDLQGASGGLHLGWASGGFLRRTASVAYGQATEQVVWSLSVSGGEGNRTNRSTLRRAAYAFDPVNLVPVEQVLDIQGRASRMDSLMINAGLEWSGLKVRLVRDKVRYHDIDLSDSELYPLLETRTQAVDLSYEWSLGDAFRLTPRLSYKDDLPWLYPDDGLGVPRRAVRRTLGSLTLTWYPARNLDLQGGVEWYEDRAVDTNVPREDLKLSNGQRTLSYDNSAVFAQALLSTRGGLFTFGARYEHPGLGKSSFVPRGAWTYVAGAFHAKLLAAKSYRAPAIQNIDDNLKYNAKVLTIRPEATTTFEAEVGYRFTQDLFGTLNAFRIRTENTILFPYKTFYGTGSRGLEAELHFQRPWGNLRGSLSLSRPSGNAVDLYRVTGREDYLYGAANEKATLSGHVRLGAGLTLDTQWIYLGPRYAHPRHGASDMVRLGGQTTGNLSLDWAPRASRLRIGLLMSNLTNAHVVHTWGWSPYLTGYDPAPGTGGREFSLRLRYNY